jgi:filamentous hemagglutinin family protein
MCSVVNADQTKIQIKGPSQTDRATEQMYAISNWIRLATLHDRSRGTRAFVLRPLVAAALSALGTLSFHAPASAAPAGGQISAGTGSISSGANGAGGTHTVIQQNSGRLAINWTSFNIGSNDVVTFAQPNSNAVALNRVTGQSPTQILGALNSNGQVFILNPNGVLFGRTAQVNVGGLLASTLNLSDSDFLAGRYHFTDSGGTGSIVNEGQITSGQSGYIAFIAPQVSNQGQLQADGGTVELAAGAAATVTLAGNRLVSLTIDQGTLDALAQNGNLIRADGGMVILTSKGQDAVLSGVVNNTGVIQARSAVNANGTIRLLADGGTAIAGGTLDASAPAGGNGGLIETSGQVFQLLPGTTITTLAAAGQTGTWLIDPNNITVAATGGNLTGAELATELTTSNVTLTTSTGTGMQAGDIDISDAVTWTSGTTLTLNADNDINITAGLNGGTNGSLTASAARNISINAPLLLGDSGSLTLSAAGTINVFAGASIQTGVFDLQQGNWNQVGTGTLAGFTAQDFEVASGASFLRANNGDGSAATPYVISDVFSLQGIGTSDALLSEHYQLAGPINALGTAQWNGGSGFVPIGTAASAFTGTFDGNGSAISGLTINRPGTDDVGLFGVMQDGTVSNLTLDNVSVTGSRFVGALAGQNTGGTIQNVDIASGAVRATSNTLASGSEAMDLGGLVGNNINDGAAKLGLISDSSVGAAVTVDPAALVNGILFGQIGGLAGANGGSITTSNSAAGVEGDIFIGGLVGANTGSIQSSSASGAVSSQTSTAGGLVGVNNGAVSASFASGAVDGKANTGGLVGVNASGATIDASYASGDVTGTSAAGGLVGMNSGLVEQSFADGSTIATSGNAGGLAGVNNGQISDSYALGRVGGSTQVGGLVGDNEGSIGTSFAAGLVQTGGTAGGLVAIGAGSVTNSYWNSDTTGISGGSGVGTPLTNDQMLNNQQTNFAGFDFNTVWSFIPGISYPYLLAIFPTTPTVISGTYSDASGMPVGGAGVDLAANGQVIANTTGGANGFYYMMLPSSTFTSGTTSVAALISSGGGPALDVAETSGASVTLNLQANTVTDAGARITLTDFLTALGDPLTGPLGTLVQPLLTQLSSTSLATVNGITLDFGSGTEFDLTGPSVSLSATGITLGPVIGGTSTLTLNAGAGDIGQDGAFTLAGLEIAGGNNATLIANGNQIGAISASLAGSLIMKDTTNLAVTQIGATTGIEVGGHASLNATGFNITLNQAITANGDGDAVVLAGNSFTNLAGAGAIVTNNGRWLVYSSSPDTDVFGSAALGTLSSGNLAQWGVNYNPEAPTSLATGDRFIFSTGQTLVVSTVANEKTTGETAQDSATIALQFAGAAFGNAFTDSASNLPSGIVVSASSAGDAADANSANGDDGEGLFRINFAASGAPAGYAFAVGTLADLKVNPVAPPPPPTPPPPPPQAPSAASPPSSDTGGTSSTVIDAVRAAAEGDATTNTEYDGTHTGSHATWLAGLDASHASNIRYEQHSSPAPAWPTRNACTP